MKKEIINKQVEQWYEVCKKCKKKVVGTSESQAEYNFKRHIEACDGDKK